MTKVAAIYIELDSNHAVKMYLDGKYSNVDWDAPRIQFPQIDKVYGCLEKSGFSSMDSGLSIDKGVDGKEILRITETKQYRIKVESDEGSSVFLPFIPNEDKFFKCKRDSDSMSIQYINYLGRSRMQFPGLGYSLEFEVVPDKIDYEKDYVELTEAIARNCAALLLEHSGATSIHFKHDKSKANTILEQFIFLRQFCFSDNLMSLFESIKRNPDRTLESEEIYKPFGVGIPSPKFYTHPFTYGKEWTRITNKSSGKTVYLPQRIAVTRKYDSLDTPANRLIKFAFERFDLICEQLRKSKDVDRASECVKEAEAMHKMFEDILHDSFFNDVGDLDIIPENNQVLLKREGYSQVFAAFSMIDLALQLNWRGQDEIYLGESKNVALLYEYWLFFELYNIISSIEGCITLKTDDHPFISADNGITLSLRETQKSRQSFELLNEGIKLNLYYNRTFSSQEFKSTGYEGSYSRDFRPDYTLALFPSSFSSEKSAIEGGSVSFVHFDAKYRVDEIESLIGSTDMEQSFDEVSEEKQDSIINTYKRGDLLKMHTYNDAIRRTVGSYVLYPGNKNTTFRLYDELLPGVGAFAFKPSTKLNSENAVRQFILDIIRVRYEGSSRQERVDKYEEMVVREPARKRRTTELSSKQDKCVLGFLRAQNESDYYNFLLQSNRLVSGEVFPFYFYAIKDGNVYSHHKDVFNSQYIRFYKNDIQSSKTYRLEPLLCEVKTNELVSKEDLVKQLNNIGYETTIDDHHADYYYVLNVKVKRNDMPVIDISTERINNINGNDAYSPHSPKVIDVQYSNTGYSE